MIKAFTRSFFKSVSNGNSSAALAYYTLFTLFPVIYLSFSICGKLIGDQQLEGYSVFILEQIFGKIDSIDFVHFVKTTPFFRSNYVLDFFSVLVLMFSCSSLMNSLKKSLNNIFDIKSTATKRKELIKETLFFRISSLGVLMAIVCAIVGIAALEMLVLTFIERIFNNDSLIFNLFLYTLSILVSFLSNGIILLLIYKFGSSKKFLIQELFRTILITALTLTIAQLGLKYYLNEFYVFSDAGLTGSILILLIWIYFCSIIMFTGAHFLKMEPCTIK